MRQVIIKGRIITLLAEELSSKPLTINLDEIDSQQNKLDELTKSRRLTEKDITMIQQLAKLGTEKEIARDLINDFQSTGWRLTKRIE